MHAFSQEELVVIAEFPMEAIKHATKEMQAMYNAHKSIGNPFKWFVAVMENWVKKNQTPQAGKSNPAAQKDLYLRTKDNWIEGHDVVQTPGTRQSTVTQVESQMEWAINVERALHDRYLNDKSFHRGAAHYANPLGELIPQSIVDEIHQNCECRSNVTMELDIRVQPAIESEVSEPKVTNWNERIMLPLAEPSAAEMPYVNDQSDWEEI